MSTQNLIIVFILIIFLKVLRGDADNGDREITVLELHNYVKKNVEEKTKTLFSDLPQIPILYTSNPERVLFRLP